MNYPYISYKIIDSNENPVGKFLPIESTIFKIDFTLWSSLTHSEPILHNDDQLIVKVFDNNINLMLASYNAGIGNVKQWHQQNFHVQYDFNQMPFLETKKYVSKTKRVYKILKILDSFKILF